MDMTVLVLLGGAVALGVMFYNRLVAGRQRVMEAWSGILVQLKRRHELVPNLLAAVDGALGHERGIVDAITQARSNAVAAAQSGDANASSSAEAKLSGALAGLKVLAESNPEITATGNVATFQKQLEETEDQIAAARRIYNSNVQAHNTRVQSIPSNIIASLAKIGEEPMFSVPEEDFGTIERAPRVTIGKTS